MDKTIEDETLALVNEINAKCEIQSDGITFQDLTKRNWYLHILSILCEYMEIQLASIQKEKNQAKALNRILQLINQLDQFDEDLTEQIKGDLVAQGNPEQVSYMVQVFAALIDAAVKENQDGEELSDENQLQNVHKQKIANIASKQVPIEIGYQKDRRSLSQGDQMNRSAQGISHQFEKSDEQSESHEIGLQKFQKGYPEMVESASGNQQNLTSPDKPHHNPFEDHSEENDSIQYLDHKMGQTKKVKKKQSSGIKKLKKNPQKNQLLLGSKPVKKLISHPKTPQTLKKARSQDQIELTHKIQQEIKKTQKKKKAKELQRTKSPVDFYLERKQKQAELAARQRVKEKKHNKQLRMQKSLKTDKEFMKVLNWRENQMRKQRKQYEESMKIRVQMQKQVYVKQINDMIIKLEKQRDITEKKQFKENLIKENDEAVKRMTALEQWYKDKLSMMRDSRQQKRNQRQLIKTGHRQIIGQIERQLKKENEQKLLQLTRRYRHQQENLQTDLEELTQKIIRVYKRN